jgi:methylenetetrahydrofolate reductase (NADPH)
MRDEGKFLGGDPIQRPPRMFVGAAANPFADPFEIRVPRLAKKIAAGVEFIQTQCIFNVEKFKLSWLAWTGVHRQAFILAGDASRSVSINT